MVTAAMSLRLVKSYQFLTSILGVGELHGLAVDVLVDVLDLEQARVRLAVGRDQAVAAEVLVAGRPGGPKSPPKAQKVLSPGLAVSKRLIGNGCCRWRRPWSTQSQMKPPWR